MVHKDGKICYLHHVLIQKMKKRYKHVHIRNHWWCKSSFSGVRLRRDISCHPIHCKNDEKVKEGGGHLNRVINSFFLHPFEYIHEHLMDDSMIVRVMKLIGTAGERVDIFCPDIRDVECQGTIFLTRRRQFQLTTDDTDFFRHDTVGCLKD